MSFSRFFVFSVENCTGNLFGGMALKRFFGSLFFLLFFLSLLSPLMASSTYRIREGDLLLISLWEEEYQQLQQVRHDGMIHLPPSGDFFIKDLTPDEARDLIAQQLQEEYPASRVLVQIMEFGTIEVGVMGAVKNPGLYRLPFGSRVYHAVTEAGGSTMEAHKEEGQLNRNGYLIPLGSKGSPSLTNYSLKDGDVIYIPAQDHQIYFLGEVESIGSIEYVSGLTLLKGLIQAGGITWRGDSQDILIIRQKGATTDYIPVNVQEILDQRAPDPLLSPGDTVLVRGKALLELTNLSFVLITVPLLLFVLLN